MTHVAQAAKQQTVLKPRCQAVKLLSCTCCKATLLSSQAVKQPSCTCCSATLSSCQTATVLKQPSCLATKLTLLQGQAAKQPRRPLAAFTLLSFSCHTASKLQHTQKSGFNSRPRPIQTDPHEIWNFYSRSLRLSM